MNRILSLLLVAFLFASCESFQEELETPTRDITFNLSTFDVTQQPITTSQNISRSTTISYAPTRLLVLDVVGDAVVQTIQKTTVEAQVATGVTKVSDVLEDLTLSLTLGSHDIYILAAYSPFSSYSTTDLTVSWSTRPTYTWAIKKTINVTSTSATTADVALPLVVGMVQLTCNDAIPTNVSKMKISGYMCWDLNLKTMKGITPTDPRTLSFDITNRTAGQYFSLFSFEPTDKKISQMTFAALQSDDTEVISHALSEVPLASGYITSYTGNFFGATLGINLSVANQWIGTTDKTY